MPTTTKPRYYHAIADEARRLREGKQTVLVVPVKPQPKGEVIEIHHDGDVDIMDRYSHQWKGFAVTDWTKLKCPAGNIGDVFGVKETWCPLERNHWIGDERYAYKSRCISGDSEDIRQEYIRLGYDYRWRSSRQMPDAAICTYCRVVSVDVKRVQAITDDEIIRIGIVSPKDLSLGTWRRCWESDRRRSHRYPFASNPWVWVVGVERMEKP